MFDTNRLRDALFRLRGRVSTELIRTFWPSKPFLVEEASEINEARIAHLDLLSFALDGKRVLEVGAGIGELSERISDRCLFLVSSEGRSRLVARLKKRMTLKSNAQVLQIDVEKDHDFEKLSGNRWRSDKEALRGKFDTLFCYGLLYHISNPEKFLARYSQLCRSVVLETVVDFTSQNYEVVTEGKLTNQAIHSGCRPNPVWLLETLRKYYSSVYYCHIVPDHPDFLWKDQAVQPSATPRMIFVASNEAIVPNVYGLLEQQISFPFVPYSEVAHSPKKLSF